MCEKMGVHWSEIRLERSPRGKPYLAAPLKVHHHVSIKHINVKLGNLPHCILLLLLISALTSFAILNLPSTFNHVSNCHMVFKIFFTITINILDILLIILYTCPQIQLSLETCICDVNLDQFLSKDTDKAFNSFVFIPQTNC